MAQIIPRGGRYGVRVHVGRDERRWIGTFATREEAEAAARKAEESAGAETWAEFADRWLEDFNYVRKDGTLRWGEEHKRNLRYAVREYVEKWGHLPLTAFPEREALPWVGQKPESILRAVRSMWNDARRSGLVTSNPFAGLGLEKSRGRADIVPLTEEELHVLADCALPACGDYGPTMRALVLWQGFVGCRPIATFNIRPDDLHPREGSVYLRHPGKRVRPRTVAVPTPALEAVTGLTPEIGRAFLFTTPTGRKLTQTSATYHWNKVRSGFESKLDPRRARQLRDARPDGGMMDFYELRHTAATILLERGLTPEDVAAQLCHTDGGELVRRLYGHPSEEGRRARVHEAFTAPAPQIERALRGV